MWSENHLNVVLEKTKSLAQKISNEELELDLEKLSKKNWNI